MPGQILGDRYEVEKQLGKQAGRWTLIARDLQTQQSVVLKVLFLDEALEPTDLRLFKREIEALKLMKHPRVPEYLSYFEHELPQDGAALVLVQSYAPGKSLAHYVEAGRRFSESETRKIAQECLEILSDLHQYDPPIIHRDIRPRNILIKRTAPDAIAVYLVDFGSVKALSPTNTALTRVGVDGYMPPEQAGGLALAVSDLYSLGATLVNIMTGIHPADLQTQGLRIQFESRVTLSNEFATWLKKLIRPTIDARWQTAQEALDALIDLPASDTARD